MFEVVYCGNRVSLVRERIGSGRLVFASERNCLRLFFVSQVLQYTCTVSFKKLTLCQFYIAGHRQWIPSCRSWTPYS